MDNIENILITAKEYMENLLKGLEKISVRFINADKEAIKDLLPLIEGIDYICKVLYLVKVEETTIEVLNNYLNEIINALENEDYILVGDLIKYELIPILDEVNSILKNTN